MANPSGEKNIGPWEGQQVEYIPLDDLVLWTENPRDPLDGDYTNDDVIRRATDGRNDKQWQLSKLSKEMGDRFDLSELPTVCRIDDGPTMGTTWMPSSCARATSAAPGSATAGHPASEIKPTSLPVSSGASSAGSSLAGVCWLSS